MEINCFVNRACDFNEFKFTEKEVCRIEFTLLGFRFLKLFDCDTWQGSGIGDNLNVFVWARWCVECGGVVHCGEVEVVRGKSESNLDQDDRPL